MSIALSLEIEAQFIIHLSIYHAYLICNSEMNPVYTDARVEFFNGRGKWPG